MVPLAACELRRLLRVPYPNGTILRTREERLPAHRHARHRSFVTHELTEQLLGSLPEPDHPLVPGGDHGLLGRPGDAG